VRHLLPPLLYYRLPHRLRAVVARRSIPFWVLTLLAASATGLTVTRAVERADAAAGGAERRAVLVVAAPVPPGGRLDETNTTLARRPRAELPDGAVTDVVAGATAIDALVPGEVVVASRLAPAGLSPAAALLPAGTRGVGVPAASTAMPVTVGDRVDVVATLPFDLAGPDGATAVVAAGATVVLVGEESVVVAVPEADVAALARALAEGSVQLVLRGAT
jgi:Flp pilus assembly protein CpaB